MRGQAYSSARAARTTKLLSREKRELLAQRAAGRAQAPGDGDHRLVREEIVEGVGHPVRSAVLAQDDHVQQTALVVVVERAPAPDLRNVRLAEYRRVCEGRLLNRPVGGEIARQLEGQAKRRLLGGDAIDARRRICRHKRIARHFGRVFEPEAEAPLVAAY